MSGQPRMWHIPIAGDPDAAVEHGLTLKAKCGLVWVPTRTGGKGSGGVEDEWPDCPRCHDPRPTRVPGRPHYVYRCYDQDDRLIYVGCTFSPLSRMDQHRLSTWWWEQVRRTRYTVFPNKSYALFAERTAIETENPRWNIRHRVRDNWTVEDYRDFHAAVAFGNGSASRLERVRNQCLSRFGVDITEPEAESA